MTTQQHLWDFYLEEDLCLQWPLEKALVRVLDTAKFIHAYFDKYQMPLSPDLHAALTAQVLARYDLMRAELEQEEME